MLLKVFCQRNFGADCSTEVDFYAKNEKFAF